MILEQKEVDNIIIHSFLYPTFSLFSSPSITIKSHAITTLGMRVSQRQSVFDSGVCVCVWTE